MGLASYALWRIQHEPWYAPDPGIALGIAEGVLVALTATLALLPLVNRATRFDAIRFE